MFRELKHLAAKNFKYLGDFSGEFRKKLERNITITSCQGEFMTCEKCGKEMMQDSDSEGQLWWFCPNEECNPDCLLEKRA